MGIDPFLLRKPQFAKRLTAEERKKQGILTAEEALAKLEARSERELQDQIVNLLHLRGVKRVIRSRMDKKTTNAKGTPDLLFVYPFFGGVSCYPGTPLAFEVKIGSEELSDDQKAAELELTLDGWRHHVIRSLDEAKVALDRLDGK